MLFVDSSHILMPGSDVDFLFGHVVPGLPAGVLLHVHDIFLPDDYPADWAWRGYNEQLGVLPLLLDPRWRPVFAGHYVATHMAEAVSQGPVGRTPAARRGRPRVQPLAAARGRRVSRRRARTDHGNLTIRAGSDGVTSGNRTRA